ncbi:serine protease 27 isoform X1 [Harmonia axyridis]|uniref:serine protease 27 isoform X1 n=2 Tax=Harmonia axyridis TaxID=115357 RepID=UPI001E279669|nr:serine protease 27 isoform X1 [Harmonia axyridis]
MRTFVLLLLYSRVAYSFSLWKLIPKYTWIRENQKAIDDNFHDYENGFENTGRVFVTLFGYPAKCQQRGVSHACTISIACWMAGGTSYSGCGASSWIVACCVPPKKKRQKEDKTENLSSKLREEPAILQRRTDEVLEECGISSDRIFMKRIIGGNKAKFGQYPWQVYIKIGSYQCGGVLVSHRYVATAAHCIISAKLKDILVYLGELDTQDTGEVSEPAPAELHRVRRKLIHPEFEYRTTQPDRYDVALLELVTEAGYADYISPICLPNSDISLSGRNAVVAGWGKTMPSNELMGTNILRSASVPILDIEECIAWHKVKEISVELHEEMLCAGHETGKRDACLGDSGGPLILLENGKWTLVGITSAGFGCGEAHQPGIYHKVALSADWIKSIINYGV